MVKIPDLRKVRERAKRLRLKRGDEVSYNVVDQTGFYNVFGEVIRVHRDGSVDVDIGWKIDRRVEPEMIAFAEVSPAGMIFIKSKKKKLKRVS